MQRSTEGDMRLLTLCGCVVAMVVGMRLSVVPQFSCGTSRLLVRVGRVKHV